MQLSKIGWTDFSGGDLNFVRGCTPVSESCANCYAAAIYKRFGLDFSQVTVDQKKLERMLDWVPPNDSPKRGAPHKPVVFLCDTGDFFHWDVPDEFIYSALACLAQRDYANWVILTKRACRMRDSVAYFKQVTGRPLPAHVWLGVTAENQARADERVPVLLDTPATTRFVSVEPCLSPVDLRGYLPSLSWTICGAESGPQRRPFDVAWALDLYEQCHEAGTSYFGKQDSGLYPGEPLVLPGYGIVHEWPN